MQNLQAIVGWGLAPPVSFLSLVARLGWGYFHADGEVVAGIFGEAVLLDPGVFQARGSEPVSEDVVHALAGELSAEGTGDFGLIGFEGVVGIEVARGEESLDGAAGNVAAVLTPFFPRAGFALFDLDQRRGGVGIEI